MATAGAEAAARVAEMVLSMPLPEYCERFLKIRTKTDGLAPFRFNVGQLYLHRRAELQLRRLGYVRLYLLKARQWGGSTYIQARQFSKIVRDGRGLRAFILTHQAAATANIFSMTHRFLEHLPPWMQQDVYESQKRIMFPKVDSSYAVATAGAKDIGHSDTVQLLHGSECALWPNADEHLKGVLQTVPPQGDGTEIFLESTGKGIGNAFQKGYAAARAGMSDYETVFVPWIWFPRRMDGSYEYAAPVSNLELSAADADYMDFWGLDEEQMQDRKSTRLNSSH